jgi:hypothetical protein
MRGRLQPVAARMCAGQRDQLRQDPRVPAQAELGLDPVLDHLQPRLLKAQSRRLQHALGLAFPWHRPAAASVLAGSPALATSDYCYVSTSSTSCKTYYIPSSYIRHFIDYRVCGGVVGASFRVRDYANQVIVESGQVGPSNCVSGRVGGLFSSYRLELHGAWSGANETIDND